MEWTDGLLVFLTALIEIWAAVPVGIGLGVPLVMNVLITIVGGIAASFAIYYAGDGLKKMLRERFFKSAEGKRDEEIAGKTDRRWIIRIWRKYGAAGLGLFAPLLTGAPVGVVIGLVLGVPGPNLMKWICAGVVLWSVILGLIGVGGMQLLS